MENFFLEIAILLGVATVLALIFRLFKQPPILAYILTGIILVPLHLVTEEGLHSLESFAEIGITFLLFMLGLELRMSELRYLGKVVLVAGIGQIAFTSVLGFLLAMLIGINPIAAMYVGLALTFSSTIVIVKLISDKKELSTLHGRLSIGILIVQDLVAILALVVLSGISNQGFSGQTILNGILISLGKAILLFVIVGFASQYLFPAILNRISKSQEILFVFSLAWALGFAAFTSSEFIGLSTEIGGLLAGIALANSHQSLQVITKIRPLRDFFIVLFFVNLGASLQISNLGEILPPALAFSLFILIGNPVIVMAILGRLGYRRGTSFRTGLTMGQISEFGLIVIFIARRANFVSDQIVSIVTLVGIITFVISTYWILYSDQILALVGPYLKIFERKSALKKTKLEKETLKNHVVIVGASRLGSYIIEKIKTMEQKVVVVDYDPDLIRELEDYPGVIAVPGDISDTEVQELAQIFKAEVVISTNPNVEDNLILINNIKHHNKKVKVIVTVHRDYYAQKLYEAGADHVIYPYEFVGNSLGNIIRHKNYSRLGKFEIT